MLLTKHQSVNEVVNGVEITQNDTENFLVKLSVDGEQKTLTKLGLKTPMLHGNSDSRRMVLLLRTTTESLMSKVESVPSVERMILEKPVDQT
jgi:hypothetical protein